MILRKYINQTAKLEFEAPNNKSIHLKSTKMLKARALMMMGCLQTYYHTQKRPTGERANC